LTDSHHKILFVDSENVICNRYEDETT